MRNFHCLCAASRFEYPRFDASTNRVDIHAMSIDALQRAVQIAGSQAALGRLVGATPRQISNWIHREKRAPARYCTRIEDATKGEVTCFALRPDVFRAPPVEDTPAAA